MYLHTWWDCSGRIKGEALLEEVCHWRWALRFQAPSQAQSLSLCLLPEDQDVKFSATALGPYWPATMLPTVMFMN